MRYKEFGLFEGQTPQILDEDLSATQVRQLKNWTIRNFEKKNIEVTFNPHFLVRVSGRAQGEYPQTVDDMGRLFFSIYSNPDILKTGAEQAKEFEPDEKKPSFKISFSLSGQTGQMLVKFVDENQYEFDTINLIGGLNQPVPTVPLAIKPGPLHDLVNDYNANRGDGENSRIQHLRQAKVQAEHAIQTYFEIQGDDLRKSAAKFYKERTDAKQRSYESSLEKALYSLQSMEDIFPNFDSTRARRSIANVNNLLNQEPVSRFNPITVDIMRPYYESIEDFLSGIRNSNSQLRNQIARENGFMSPNNSRVDPSRTLAWMRNNRRDPKTQSVMSSNTKLKELIKKLELLEQTPSTDREPNKNSDLNTLDSSRVDLFSGNIRQTQNTYNNRANAKRDLNANRAREAEKLARTFRGRTYNTKQEADSARKEYEQQQEIASRTWNNRVYDTVEQMTTAREQQQEIDRQRNNAQQQAQAQAQAQRAQDQETAAARTELIRLLTGMALRQNQVTYDSDDQDYYNVFNNNIPRIIRLLAMPNLKNEDKTKLIKNLSDQISYAMFLPTEQKAGNISTYKQKWEEIKSVLPNLWGSVYGNDVPLDLSESKIRKLKNAYKRIYS